MRDGFQMVARVPYPATIPKYSAVASEAATMDLLRSSGLPVPRIYGYSPAPDNAAETEYIFMEFVQGTKLSDIWFELGESEIISFSRQLAELESKMMSLAFPAGGSLYYTKDLEKTIGAPGISLEDARFCVGPDTRMPLCFGRRSQLEVGRGPYKGAEEALIGGADKELAYLKQFGRPLLPFHRGRREAYQYKDQPPSDHIENLNRYLLIASSLVPKNPDLSRFCIRHPDLQPNNIFVSRSPDSDLRIVGLIDWQHSSILPQFLLAGIPQCIQNYNDPVSQNMARPSLPENFEDLDQAKKDREKELHRRRLVHYHYVKTTGEYNTFHYTALTDSMSTLRLRLFENASDPWEGETLKLKVALIEAAKKWEALTGGTTACPLVFDAEDVRKTAELDEVVRGANQTIALCEGMIGCRSEGWVPTDRYEEAMARSNHMKEVSLAMAESDQERTEIVEHWPFGDMNEEEYM